MAGEIQVQHDTTAQTLYAQVRNNVGQIWNGSAFESYATANIATYAILLTEQGTASAYYTGTFPSAIPMGVYPVAILLKVGGSYAETDTKLTGGLLNWSGSTVIGGANAILRDSSLTTAKLGTFVLAKTTNISGFTDLSAVQVENAVWDATTSSHATSGTMGASVGSSATAAGVWSYATRAINQPVTLDFTQNYPSSPTSGTVGQAVNYAGTRLDVSVSSRGTGDATSAALSTAQGSLDTLTGRLTSTRAGYLDSLASGVPTAATIATNVWTKDISAISTSGYAGTLLNATSTATNLATAQTSLNTLTGRLTSTRAGYLDNLSAGVPTASAISTAVWQTDISGYNTSNQAGYYLNHAATNSGVWAVGTRTLTSGANIVLAKGTGVTGFNDIAATAIVSNGAITTSGGKVSNVALCDLTTTTTTATNVTNGVTVSSAGLTAIANALLDLANGVETGVTMRQSLRAIASAVLGQVSGAGTGVETFQAIGNPSTNRAVVTVSGAGNRTNVALNL